MQITIYGLGILGTIGLFSAGILYSSHRVAFIWVTFATAVIYLLAFSLFWHDSILKKNKQNEHFVTATQESPQDVDEASVVSRGSILSLNSIRIYFIEIAKNMYQIGLVCEIANLGQRAHLVKHINFNGDAFDIVPRAPIHFKKAFLQEDIIKGQIIGDNFLAPNKNKFLLISK